MAPLIQRQPRRGDQRVAAVDRTGRCQEDGPIGARVQGKQIVGTSRTGRVPLGDQVHVGSQVGCGRLDGHGDGELIQVKLAAVGHKQTVAAVKGQGRAIGCGTSGAGTTAVVAQEGAVGKGGAAHRFVHVQPERRARWDHPGLRRPAPPWAPARCC